MSRLLIIALLMATSALATAQVRYISDEPRVPLRDAPCATCAPVHPGLVPGTPLTVEDSENGWSRVVLEDGRGGWLPSHYLASRRASDARFENLDASSQSVREENIQLRNQLSELTSAHEELQRLHGETRELLTNLEVELSTVRKLSANVLGLQEQNEELIRRNRMLQSDIDVLTASRDQLQGDHRQKWFLYGGLTVVLGALLAVLLPGLRPRRRYSEWA